MMKRGEGNIFGGIFIKHGELHVIANIFKTKFRRTETYFNEKHIGDENLTVVIRMKGFEKCSQT